MPGRRIVAIITTASLCPEARGVPAQVRKLAARETYFAELNNQFARAPARRVAAGARQRDDLAG
jgi:hypothetical protein